MYNALTRFVLMRDIQNSRLKTRSITLGREQCDSSTFFGKNPFDLCLKVTLLPASCERTLDELHAYRTGRRNALNVYVFIFTVFFQSWYSRPGSAQLQGTRKRRRQLGSSNFYHRQNCMKVRESHAFPLLENQIIFFLSS